jgi:hypothetical protein
MDGPWSRSMVRRLLWTTVWMLVAIVVAGCTAAGTDPEPIESAAPTTTDANFPEVPLSYTGPPVTVALLVEGTIHIDPESLCVTLSDSPDLVQIVAFPAGATIDLSDAAKPAVLMKGCRPLADGDLVEFTGMGSMDSRDAIEEQVDPAYLERCGATTEHPYLAGICTGPSRQYP